MLVSTSPRRRLFRATATIFARSIWVFTRLPTGVFQSFPKRALSPEAGSPHVARGLVWETGQGLLASCCPRKSGYGRRSAAKRQPARGISAWGPGGESLQGLLARGPPGGGGPQLDRGRWRGRGGGFAHFPRAERASVRPRLEGPTGCRLMDWPKLISFIGKRAKGSRAPRLRRLTRVIH